MPDDEGCVVFFFIALQTQLMTRTSYSLATQVHIRPLLGACLAILTLALVGCGATRPEATPEELVELDAQVAKQQSAVRMKVLEGIVTSLQRDIQAGREPQLDVLMLSGGGAKGAFGSAFLRSWQENVAKDHTLAFPQFDLVSGISTVNQAALIAPYAVIGTPERLQEAENIYREADPEWVSFSFWGTVTGGRALLRIPIN